MPAQNDSIIIYWSDLGINQWRAEARLGDDFRKFDERKRETIVVPEGNGQILIPMPRDASLPKSEEEWQMFSCKVYDILRSRINDALVSGEREFEVRTEQNINTEGYFAPWRQEAVTKFTRSFFLALDRLKGELSSKYSVAVNGIWGSNGGYMASKVIPELRCSPVDAGILIDARAWKADVRKLYHAIGGNLAIINTAGDAPATNLMVADHGTAKALKKELSGLKVYWVDCKGLDVFIKQHLGAMHWNSSLLAKEFTANGYNKLGRMTGASLRDHIIGSFNSSDISKGKLHTARAIFKPERDKKYPADFHPPPPPPPPTVTRTQPGDLIIRHKGKTLGPIGGIPHIGIYTGNRTEDGTSYDAIDLGIKNGKGVIRPSHSTDESRFKDPGFYSLLESQIPVRHNGEITTLSALPQGVKNAIRENVCKMAEKDLSSTYGEYEFSQFPKGHSVNCGDWVLDLYNKALTSEGVQVMSHKFPGSHILPGAKGLKSGELKDYAELLWGSTDPSRLPGWLPEVNPPQVSTQDRGGVYIAPTPTREGKKGSEVREKVLDSRPSEDSLSWPVDISDTEE